MLSRIFWFIAAVLFALSLVLFTVGIGEDAGGFTDFRAWLLLASGVVAAAMGNVSRTTDPNH